MIRYILSIGILALIALYLFLPIKKCNPFHNEKNSPRYVIVENNKLIGFNLVDPESAPESIRDSVKRGYSIIMNTPFYAANYAKNHLTCGNCHLCEGNSLGGRNQGISLLGVTSIYPQYSERSKKTVDLKERIFNCFERSMNGIRPPGDSQVMKDILAYIDWISTQVKDVSNPPWLGLKLLKSKHEPNVEQGKIVYEKYCVACHETNGEGGGDLPFPVGKTIPPLWGKDSFNNGAGMNTLPMLSSFVYWNMPFENSVLTEEQAIDVAAFIIKQPRPEFKK